MDGSPSICGRTRVGRRCRRQILLLAVCFGCLASPLVRADLADTRRKLTSALSSLPHPQAVVGACVVDLRTGETVFARDADTPLVPASAQKVFTMTAALVELGPEFVFETVLATDGRNLFVIGDGDPALGDEKLCSSRGEARGEIFARWAVALRERGITSVPGDLVLDETIFDEELVHPSWEPSDLGKWYAAPVAGLNINDNCLDVTVHPADRAGELVRIEVEPANELARFVNKCRTGQGRDPILHHEPGTFEYVISGQCSKRWPFVPVAFPNPGLLFAGAMKTGLAAHGVRIAGTARRQRIRGTNLRMPDGVTVVAIHRTPIADAFERTGKDSQNLFAEALLKRTAYAWQKRQGAVDPRGSFAGGAQAVLATVRGAGIDPTGMVVADGSGLSRDNRCTARQLTELLVWLHRHPAAEFFADSLSVAGVDGSLRKRLTALDGRVRGKTGTMRQVRSLAAYVEGADGRRFAFTVIFNGYKGPSTPYRQIQDRVCRILSESSPAPTGSN